MHGLVFWLVYPILWVVSILPFRLFYMFSDAIFFLVYYVIGYRRKTVRENLKLVFPDKPEMEINRIEKKFYSHMCDMFLEMIKSISISEKEIAKRFTFTNLDYLRKLESLDKSLIVMCGHYASYEWINALQLYGLKYKTYGIYKKIKNEHFDSLVKKIRGRFGGTLITTQKTTEVIRYNQEHGILGNYGMIADQSPKLSRAKHWIDFMGIKVPVFDGSDRLARKMDMAVVYLHVEKVGRGYYEATLKPITEDAPGEPPHAITKKFVEYLEKQIYKKPEYYLWTHKRWKHRNEPIPDNAEIID
ncbi:lysophospholipid acyltransferase family protein [Christiangramia sabulilitoris]|uniref:Lysophospholipid acyltransferase family protein n=1 Tax=Christiangramia sabulilitoris TaxID=2583991 RepID=A0A550I2C6_9FLAO|nr:lysophospholipid acyltransferase family protein [Christiangramia sabulilitoris]TRO65134.1 lysophospholipid acyltransferase family protein [Christiangramia sabulilitoris]